MSRKRLSHTSKKKKGSKRGPSSHKNSKRAASTKESVRDWKRHKGEKPKHAVAQRKKRYALGKSRKQSYKKRLSPGQKGIAEIFCRYKLPKQFPEKVQQAAKTIVAPTDIAALLEQDVLRRDCRDVCCVTVDPTDAKDFDDALYAEKLSDGTYFLSVHIADVSYYVEPGTPLDKEASARTCSVYLANQVVPMLPFNLSDDICSLVPGQDRLAMTVEMHLSPNGEVLEKEAFPSVIRSKARLTYETVQQFLDEPASPSLLETPSTVWGISPNHVDTDSNNVSHTQETANNASNLQAIATSLQVASEIAEKRRARRAKAGSLEFESQELSFVFDKQGVPIKIEKRIPTQATRMVEEAMLLANECVATLLSELNLKTAYRVHEAPKQENLEAAVPILREFKLLQPGDAEQIVAANPHALERILERAAKTPYHFLVSQLLLRAQKKATYAPENEGHYALQAPAYLHFTSPIRRYPDILVHRTIKALLGNTMRSKQYQHQLNNLGALCEACSEGEKRATEAERASDDVKMAEFYLSRVGNIEEGTIVGVEEFGCFIELAETGAQGLLPTRLLSRGEAAGDWFVYDEKHLSLRGEQSLVTYELGQTVQVRVESVNVVRGYINFDLPPTHVSYTFEA